MVVAEFRDQPSDPVVSAIGHGDACYQSGSAKFNIKANAIAPLALTRMTENILGGLGDKLDPSLISPLVTFLAHEDCPATGRIFSVGGGRVAEIFIGETKGYVNPALAAEHLRDNWDQITDHRAYFVPENLNDESGIFLKALS